MCISMANVPAHPGSMSGLELATLLRLGVTGPRKRQVAMMTLRGTSRLSGAGTEYHLHINALECVPKSPLCSRIDLLDIQRVRA